MKEELVKEELPEATEAQREEQARFVGMLAETEAMRKAFDALSKLDVRARRRVMRWLGDAIWTEEEAPF